MIHLLPIAASVVLAWDATSEALLYHLYVGIQSLVAGNPPLAEYSIAATEFRVGGLDYRTEYFFVVTAINSQGVESGYSNEVRYTPEPGHSSK